MSKSDTIQLTVMLHELSDQLAACQRRCAELETLLNAASHALRSYQYGNGSGELAESIADKIDAALTALRASAAPGAKGESNV